MTKKRAKAAKVRPAERMEARSPEMKEAILSAMALKALQGNVSAAKIVLEADKAAAAEVEPVQIIIDV